MLLLVPRCLDVDVWFDKGVEVTRLGGGGMGESLLERLVSMSVSAPLMCSSVSLSHSGQDSVSDWTLS